MEVGVKAIVNIAINKYELYMYKTQGYILLMVNIDLLVHNKLLRFSQPDRMVSEHLLQNLPVWNKF